MSICVERNSDEAAERLDELLELIREKARADTSCSDVGEYEEQVIEVVHRIGAWLMARELGRHETDEKDVLVDGVPHARAVLGNRDLHDGVRARACVAGTVPIRSQRADDQPP